MATFSPYMESRYGLKPSSYGVLRSDALIQPENKSLTNAQKADFTKSALAGFGEYGANKQNSFISAMTAASLDAQGSMASSRARQESRQVIGAQKVGTAVNGLQMTGSALDALDQSQRESEYDAFMKKAAYTVQANAAKVKGQQERSSAVSSLMEGGIGALMSLRPA